MSKAYHERRQWMTAEEYEWEYMPLIGREFGSPDYDRLTKIDKIASGAIIEQCPDTGLLVGHVPGIAGATAQGATREEVIDHLREVLEMMSESNRDQPVRKDPRKKTVPANERRLHEPETKDNLARAGE